MIELSRRHAVAVGVLGLALLVSASAVLGQWQAEPSIPNPDHPPHPMHDLRDATAALPIATATATVDLMSAMVSAIRLSALREKDRVSTSATMQRMRWRR